MDINLPLPLLAGMTPAQFMRRHWQKKPLLVRAALPGFEPLLSRIELQALASRQGVESRLIVQGKSGWRMTSGPFAPRGIPPMSQPGWTLLVQGVDGHDAQCHALLQQFRFVPDARLDDLMISMASPSGGVGPHFDSYDVFLLQASGQRRWRIGQQKDLSLQSGVPLKILQNFAPEEEFVLNAGDMLYLPPRYAHDGVALANVDAKGKAQDCMTYSIGFRAPAKLALAAELLHRLAEFSEDAAEDAVEQQSAVTLQKPIKKSGKNSLYRDPTQMASSTPAALPGALLAFATEAVMQALQDPMAIACALGEVMTELKPGVWFDESATSPGVDDWRSGLRLDVKTRMMYDTHHVFINGDSYRAKGADATLMQLLADQRALSGTALCKISRDAFELLADWHAAGWLHGEPEA